MHVVQAETVISIQQGGQDRRRRHSPDRSPTSLGSAETSAFNTPP